MPTLRIDRVRLETTSDPDENDTMHVQAIAKVSYETAPAGTRRIEWLRSAGLGGIDPASSHAYFREIELDELADLADHLAHFGIVTTVEDLRRLL